MKLTCLNDTNRPESKVDDIIKLIEQEFGCPNLNKNHYEVCLTVFGTFTEQDLKTVCDKYQACGWRDVNYVASSIPTCTTRYSFTFKY